MKIHVKQLPCPEVEFRAKLAAYINAREAHKETEGEPAPIPEFEILRTIADSGMILEVFDGDEPLPDNNTPAPVRAILALERANPITHRGQREFYLGFGEAFPQFKETHLYKESKRVDDLIRAERAKL